MLNAEELNVLLMRNALLMVFCKARGAITKSKSQFVQINYNVLLIPDCNLCTFGTGVDGELIITESYSCSTLYTVFRDLLFFRISVENPALSIISLIFNMS